MPARASPAASASLGVLRNGPPEAVRISFVASLAQSRAQALVSAVVLAIHRDQFRRRAAATASITSCPPAKPGPPYWPARRACRRKPPRRWLAGPQLPTIDDITVSTSGAVAMLDPKRSRRSQLRPLALRKAACVSRAR